MHSFYLPPGNLDLVVVRGGDAARLLQGQVTCDVASIPDPGFARGALCNNKGRVLATFILVRQGDSFYLAMSRGLGEVLTPVLKKYLPFYKSELLQLPATSCFGAVGSKALQTLGAFPEPAGGHCANLANGWVCTLDAEQQQYLVHTPGPLAPPAELRAGTLPDWFLVGIQSGQFPFEPADVEKYTPQDLQLDRHGYVSFTKGCYTGQEIVARMHYRGKLKKLLFVLEADSGEIEAGSSALVDAEGHVLATPIKVFAPDSGLTLLAPLPAEMENGAVGTVKNAAGLQFRLRVF